MKIKTHSLELLADLHTPVAVFMKARELFSQVLLLESSDYSSKENSHSFVCFEPIAGFDVRGDSFSTYHLDKRSEVAVNANINELVAAEIAEIEIVESDVALPSNGFFGFTCFDAVEHFDTVKLEKSDPLGIPTLRYDFYRFVVSIDHFYGTLRIIENCPVDEASRLDEVQRLLSRQDNSQFGFSLVGAVRSTLTDDAFKSNVTAGKAHCHRGDVFQVVVSKRFEQTFSGDDFNVYRTLRSVNPSPYLYYFDYADFRLFGSSPEAQLIVADGEAEIHPIAGTVRRTGDNEKDLALAESLKADPKENAEHVMLVDLARNDLSRNCSGVEVDTYKEIQRFSHVMHLVSKVKGKVANGSSDFQVFADTFPAGTLSGAPKYRALQIIDALEPHRRSFYGGAIGLISLSGGLNQAIIIRSFLSKGNTLYWQAGAGIVIDSDEEKELEEVNNKLGALRKALLKAEKLT